VLASIKKGVAAEGTGLGYGRGCRQRQINFYHSRSMWVSVPEDKEGNRNCDRKVRIVSVMGRAVNVSGNGNLYILFQIRMGKAVRRGNNSSRGK